MSRAGQRVVQPQHVMLSLREGLTRVTLYTSEIERIDLPNRQVTIRGHWTDGHPGQGYGLAEIRGLRLDGLPAVLIARMFFLANLPNWHRRIALLLDWMSSLASPRDITQLRISRSNALVPMRFGAGEEILRSGEAGSRFYIITSGEVEAVRQTMDGREEQLNRLGPGQYFGEIAMLQEGTRTATERATTETLARPDCIALVEHMPLLRAALDRTPYRDRWGTRRAGHG